MTKPQDWWLLLLMSLISLAANVTSSCCKQSGTVLDCSNCQLTEIQASEINDKTTRLLLSDNNITVIPNDAFRNCASLTHLSLLNNPLQELHTNSFRGLAALQQLELGSSKSIVRIPNKFPVDIFQPLGNLTQLSFFYSFKGQDLGLQYLTNLTHFEIYMSSKAVLGREFTHLRNLKSLYVYGHSKHGLTTITNETFAAIPQVETLHITISVRRIMSNAFQSLQKLTTLGLPCNRLLNISDVIEAIKNQNKATVKTLILDGIAGQQSLAFTADFFNSPNFRKVTRLTMRKTKIMEADLRALYNLPQLDYFGIGFNSPLRLDDEQEFNNQLQHLNNMKIESIDLDFFYDTNYAKFKKKYCEHFSKPEEFFHSPMPMIKPPKSLPGGNRTIIINPHDHILDRLLHNIPPTMLYVYIRNFPIEIPITESVYFNEDNNLIFFDMAGENFPFPNVKLLTGFDKLQGVDFSHSGLSDLHPDQCNHLPSIKYINIAHNNFQEIVLTNCLSKPRPSIQWLDVSYNNLSRIKPNAFENITAIEYINLQGNQLKNISFDLSKNTKLQMLDISNCSLVTLTKYFIGQLDNLIAQTTRVLSLDISNNNFSCSCALYKWIMETKVNIVNKDQLTCTYNNTRTQITTMNLTLLGCHPAIQLPTTTSTSPVTSTVPAPTSSVPAHSTTSVPANVTSIHETTTNTNHVLKIVSPVVVVLILTVLTIILIIVYRKRILRFAQESRHADRVNDALISDDLPLQP